MDDTWRELFDTEQVIARRSRPDDGPALDWLLRTKAIVTVLPGIYALAGQQVIPEIRVAALQLWEPRAVLTHEAAARYLGLADRPAGGRQRGCSPYAAATARFPPRQASVAG